MPSLTVLDLIEVGLKCLSARFVIDIVAGLGDFDGGDRACLKCLSARFVIDISILDTVEVEAESVSNAFRLDS